ncbi:MAG: site-2 protease family protein [Oscillospiraceae bacterium]|nr:site-2 protease family protein [Oscillospiraceae bacterium]
MTVLFILIAILIFGFLIFIHEFGHFITAKLCGVRVNEFSINMGPKLFGWKRGETQYSFRLIPIGGYCAMEGEDGDSEDPRSFASAKWWKRLIILCAGAFMNLLTGFVVMAFLYGFEYQVLTPEILKIEQGSALSEQGLQPGDELYSFDGKRLYFRDDFYLLEGRYDPNDVELVVLRNGEKVTYPHFRMEKREFKDKDGNPQELYGFSFGKQQEPNFLNATKYGALQCVDFTRMVWYGLQDLFTGRAGLKDMGGAVQVVDVIVQGGTEVSKESKTSDGICYALYIGAFIAVNLAVMNMLPIPALDGGRVLFLLIGTVYTAITKKKINPKYEAWIHGVTMVLLLGLMAFLFLKDIFVILRR